jgi:hypothetical protein
MSLTHKKSATITAEDVATQAMNITMILMMMTTTMKMEHT